MDLLQQQQQHQQLQLQQQQQHQQIPATTNAVRKSKSKSQPRKNIPVELTAYGTTPSGKPRLFVCQTCTRAFARLEHLRRHERSHTKEKPFTCGVCQRKFSRRDLLLRHAQKLHAGCADAITRLRRKSIKKLDAEQRQDGKSSNDNDDEEEEEDEDEYMEDDDDRVDEPGAPESNNSETKNTSGGGDMSDDVQFNLNLFTTDVPQKPLMMKYDLLTPSNSVASSSRTSRRESSADTAKANSGTSQFSKRVSLDRQIANRRRGVSFSAQSGPNYALAMPGFNNDRYPERDNIEFSTPQLLPTTTMEETSWLNNLSTIPNLNDKTLQENNGNGILHESMRLSGSQNASDLRTNSISLSLLEQGTMMRDDSIASNTSFLNSVETPMGNPLSILAIGSARKGSASASTDFNTPGSKIDDVNEYGYSFYDIPESMLMNSHMSFNHNYKSLTPIKQEMDSETGSPDHQHHQDSFASGVNHNTNGNGIRSNAEGGQVHDMGGVKGNDMQYMDLNFLNDMDELTNELDVGSKFLPGGYSFYGDILSVSSSGIDTGSPNGMNSPNHATGSNSLLSNQYPLSYETLNRTQYESSSGNRSNNLNGTNGTGAGASASTPQSMLLKSTLSKRNQKLAIDSMIANTKYSRTKLFTTNMRHLINKALSKYPISGIMSPAIPLNEKLEFFLNSFVTIFLSHFPFIHPTKLNEFEIMQMTSNEDSSVESARVCLPLLIATIGALLSNNKNDLEHMYEALRRIIHIYLESRKNNPPTNQMDLEQLNNDQSSSNPIWLIQSLTLSVIYGLFSDNENNVYVVIRQLNALNSLVKSLIRSNRNILFAIGPQDEFEYNMVNHNPSNLAPSENNLLFNQTVVNDDMKYRNNINVQSQIRIIFMIYRLTNFLLMMYNVPHTLSFHDLGLISPPTKNEEFLWSFSNHLAFQEYLTNSNVGKTLDDYLLDTTPNVSFRDTIQQLAQQHSDANEWPFEKEGKLENSDALVLSLFNQSKFGLISIIHGVYELKQYPEMHNVNIFQILNSVTEKVAMSKSHIVSPQSKVQQYYEKLDFAMMMNFVKINSLINLKYVKEQSWLRNFDELTLQYNKCLMKIGETSEADYLTLFDCCLIILRLVLCKSEDGDDPAVVNNDSAVAPAATTASLQTAAKNAKGGRRRKKLNEEAIAVGQNIDFLAHLFTGQSSSKESTDDYSNFGKMFNLVIHEDFDHTKNTIHSQMIFHAFTVLSIILIYILKRINNHSDLSNNPNHQSPQALEQFTAKFEVLMKLLEKVENYLRIKYHNSKFKLDELSFLMYSSHLTTISLERLLYLLKMGELILNYLFDANMKVCIFKRLAGSLSEIRKFLIDNENRILA
ncbi:uncharacterized protein KQ657_000383 [Scheffersomyces spartinae]|uniref:C2H2-type domain-containing protein n=1 Tax=Scheffersomyces spartinae TaxID=45513 RepID=A0A9P8AJ11_9ASCO|nr:uncharacterized protein KQ657_000383 [Scheffersomyces spartinae]KAG7193696.1 hypothetical protein KQ657_000383 [Scheffersomyces spartinae]